MRALLLLGLLLMARTPTTAQAEALAALDRATHVKVEVEGPDGHMVDFTELEGEDFFDALTIEASEDEPVAALSVRLRRDVVGPDGTLLSLSPLMEGSDLNVDSLGAYAPAVDIARRVYVYIATMLPGETPASADWEWLFDGIVDDPEFGGRESRLVLEARDPMGRLNDTIIETTTSYGGGSPLDALEDVMQEILNAEMGSGEFPLTVVGDPDFGINEYQLGNVSVLEALLALRDLIGWNLHWRWLDSPAEFGLTLYEPTRNAALLSGYTPDHTIGPDDYYDVGECRLISAGMRNAGEVIYTDSNGDDQIVSDTRSTSVGLYYRRFIRLDERGGQITTQTQAETLLANVLDDLEGASLAKTVECAFLWNVELGDTVRFTANGVHYDTDQDLAVVGYRHELAGDRKRTILHVVGKPSGGYQRWLRLEHRPAPPDVTGLEVDFNANGEAIVSVAATPNARTIYVTVGDGTEPDAPTASANDGTITGRSGTVATTVKITTGNVAYVKAVAVGENARPGSVKSAQYSRLIGPFHKDTADRSVSSTSPTIDTLETVTIPGGTLGINGALRLTAVGLVTGSAGNRELFFSWDGVSFLNFTIPGGSGTSQFWVEAIITNDGATNAQDIWVRAWDEDAQFVIGRSVDAADTTGDVDLVVSGRRVSGDGVTLQVTMVELLGTN